MRTFLRGIVVLLVISTSAICQENAQQEILSHPPQPHIEEHLNSQQGSHHVDGIHQHQEEMTPEMEAVTNDNLVQQQQSEEQANVNQIHQEQVKEVKPIPVEEPQSIQNDHEEHSQVAHEQINEEEEPFKYDDLLADLENNSLNHHESHQPIETELPKQNDQDEWLQRQADIEKIKAKTNKTMVGFAAPVVASVTIIDYLIAADLLMNIQFRMEKLIVFSKKSMEHIHTQWGVPEPYNKGVFVLLSLFSIYIFQKIFGKLFSRSQKGQQNYRFNTPDFAEIGILVNSVKQLQGDVTIIKNKLEGGAAASSNSNSSRGELVSADSKLTAIMQQLTQFDTISKQMSLIAAKQQALDDLMNSVRGQFQQISSTNITIKQDNSKINGNHSLDQSSLIHKSHDQVPLKKESSSLLQQERPVQQESQIKSEQLLQLSQQKQKPQEQKTVKEQSVEVQVPKQEQIVPQQVPVRPVLPQVRPNLVGQRPPVPGMPPQFRQQVPRPPLQRFPPPSQTVEQIQRPQSANKNEIVSEPANKPIQAPPQQQQKVVQQQQQANEEEEEEEYYGEEEEEEQTGHNQA